MWRQIVLVAALLGLAVIAAAVVQKNSGGNKTTREPGLAAVVEAPPVEALNTCIQERFHSIVGVGMTRMPVSPLHMRSFRPETKAEKAAVAKLQKDGWIVGMYLGGRVLMRPKPSKAAWYANGAHRYYRAVGEPLFITANAATAKLPPSWDLWEHGRKALVASSSQDKYTAPLGRWLIDARPVRASKESCLKCHAAQYAPVPASQVAKVARPMRLGDAVGVVMYVYRRATKDDAPLTQQRRTQSSARQHQVYPRP